MDFGEVLGTAGKIFWKYKVLWIFGILAGCGSRSSSPSFNYRFGNQDFQTMPDIQRFFNQMDRQILQIPTWVYIVIGVAVLLLILLVVFLSTIGRIGLISGTLKADDGAASLSFGSLFQDGLTFFWRVFLLDLLLFLLVMLVLAILIVPSIALGVATQGVGLLALIPLWCAAACVLGIVFWLLGLVMQQAIVAIVAENLGLGQGVQRGWWVVRNHIGPVLLIALILGIGGGIIGVIISLPYLAAVIPAVVAVAGQTQRTLTTGLIAALLIALAYTPFAIFLQGLLQTYIGSVWALTFRRLVAPRPMAPAMVVPPPSEPPAPGQGI